MGQGVGTYENDARRGHVEDDRLRAPRRLYPRQVLARAQANGRSATRDGRNGAARARRNAGPLGTFAKFPIRDRTLRAPTAERA